MLCDILFWFYYRFVIDSLDLSYIYFRVASLALGQSYDCPSASKATLKDMDKIDRYTIGSMCLVVGRRCI